jgi:hypothetical protein
MALVKKTASALTARELGLLADRSARNRDIHALVYAHKQGASLDFGTTLCAVIGGSLECLKYAHHHNVESLHWKEDPAVNLCTMAANFGHLECLQYLHEHGCLWCDFTITTAIQSKQTACLYYAVSHGCPFWAPDFRDLIDDEREQLWAARRRWHKALYIARWWKAARDQRRKWAVRCIEHAVLKWMLRPGHGMLYEKAKQNFEASPAGN